MKEVAFLKPYIWLMVCLLSSLAKIFQAFHNFDFGELIVGNMKMHSEKVAT